MCTLTACCEEEKKRNVPETPQPSSLYFSLLLSSIWLVTCLLVTSPACKTLSPSTAPLSHPLRLPHCPLSSSPAVTPRQQPPAAGCLWSPRLLCVTVAGRVWWVGRGRGVSGQSWPSWMLSRTIWTASLPPCRRQAAGWLAPLRANGRRVLSESQVDLQPRMSVSCWLIFWESATLGSVEGYLFI